MHSMRLKSRRWTRLEYERLVEQRVFQPGEHLELLDGVLVVREPQGTRHAAAVAAARELLAGAFGPGHHVRGQSPVALDDTSEPEPDLAVVRGAPWDYRDDHPSTPLLVVEVADSTLALDRRYKRGLYARAGITEYWIVNLVDLVLEVYREPVPSSSSPHRWHYQHVQFLGREAAISPLNAPAAPIAVAGLLPPA
jgi:Uma2 family endonuclease